MTAKAIKKPTTTDVANVNRTSAGLRDALFDEMDAIRTGVSNPTRANAVARLASGVVETVQMELEVERFVSATARRVDTGAAQTGLPRALALGA